MHLNKITTLNTVENPNLKKVTIKNFSSRKDLDFYIAGIDGSNIEIQGTREELKQFQLSDKNTIMDKNNLKSMFSCFIES